MQSWHIQSALFPGVDAEQGEPYGPVVEQLSLEKEQLGAPTIWANYKTRDFSPCMSQERNTQQSSGFAMEMELPCVLSPDQLCNHPSLDALGYHLSLSALITEVTCSKCSSRFILSLCPVGKPSASSRKHKCHPFSPAPSCLFGRLQSLLEECLVVWGCYIFSAL